MGRVYYPGVLSPGARGGPGPPQFEGVGDVVPLVAITHSLLKHRMATYR